MIRALRPAVLRVLKHSQATVTFVDVGSRNGVLDLRDIAPHVVAYGFEPNPSEYEKLVSGKTDHFLAHGYGSPKYRQLTYYPYALGESCGRREFFITHGPGACGLLEPNVDGLQGIGWQRDSFQRNFDDDFFAATKTIEVDVRTLDSFAAERQLEHIDYLKVDVEGAEYEVFEGARAILPRTGVIRAETCFVPARKGQKLFSHVDVLLREFGFDLIRYEIDPHQVGYKQRAKPVDMLAGQGHADPYGQPLCAEAIYVNRAIADPARALAQAVVLMERNYLDEALHLIKTKTSVNDVQLLAQLATVQAGGWGQRLRKTGYRAVDAVVDAAGRFASTLRREKS